MRTKDCDEFTCDSFVSRMILNDGRNYDKILYVTSETSLHSLAYIHLVKGGSVGVS